MITLYHYLNAFTKLFLCFELSVVGCYVVSVFGIGTSNHLLCDKSLVFIIVPLKHYLYLKECYQLQDGNLTEAPPHYGRCPRLDSQDSSREEILKEDTLSPSF